MKWLIRLLPVGAGVCTGVAVLMLTGGATGAVSNIVIAGLLLFSMIMINQTTRAIADGTATTARHHHTFGPWETSWYKNENGTKAGVCEQIQTCSGCGYIKRRKP